MIRINLLPFRAARTKENVRRQISIFILIIVLMFLVMFMVTLKLNSEKKKHAAMVEGVKTELAKYTKQAREVDKLKTESAKLQQKIDIISTLEDIRREPVELFTALTEVVVPERMWLTSFKTKGRQINIVGSALDQITVADFAKRLENSPAFVDVKIKNLKSGTTKNKVAIKTFVVDCKIGDIKKEEMILTGKAVK